MGTQNLGFFRTVNPISTRGADYVHHITTSPQMALPKDNNRTLTIIMVMESIIWMGLGLGAFSMALFGLGHGVYFIIVLSQGPLKQMARIVSKYKFANGH